MYLRLVFPFLLFAAIALTLSLRRPSRRWRLLTASLAFLFLASWPPTAWLLNGLVEGPYKEPLQPAKDAQAIVVLSGGAWPPDPRQPYSILLTSSIVRVRHAAWLYETGTQVPVVVCGRHFTVAPEAPPVSDLMEEALIGWGVSPSDIWKESEGTSTYSQSLAAGAILRANGIDRILVVTEAYHMRRAIGCFRRQGFDASPAPCGFRGVPDPIHFSHFLPGYQAILLNEEALREMAALAVYRLTGKI